MGLATAIASFNRIVRDYGVDVNIVYRTPQLDKDGNKVRNDNGQVQVDTTDVSLRCSLKILDGSERIINNTVLESGDAVAHFMLKDAQYLNKDTTLKVDYGYGNTYTYKMLKPIPKKTHINVYLTRAGGS
ncbi:hypothetical protein [Methanobacterium paludis]|uniref:Uncharacterized protein n=1 Tax=Methanobacterium paludis (strain DSM 25820 / JCM 18151 / SWAN1) TaxID=868131 RepID=F6D2R2_METPW|nr:hypothetical protein [Methanobacterium paludis]AEG18641.1 hypothetical protein MSWAN_1630 [Methanobacterium paludis]